MLACVSGDACNSRYGRRKAQPVASSAAVTDEPRQQRRLVRTAEAARELGVDPATLRRWARAGTVTPATRTLGGQDRWDLDDLRKQVRERLEGS